MPETNKFFVKNFFLFISVMLLFHKGVFAQHENEKGHVTVLQDSVVAMMLKRNATISETKQTMPGYRIQLYFGSDRTKAGEIRNEFIKDHPETGAYLVYQQPNFKVRAGDYKTRLEAVKAMQLISAFYPSAFIVKDDVHLPKID